MRSRVTRLSLVALSTLLLSVTASADTWTIDTNHSHVGFSVRHLLTPVPGSFGDFAGVIVYDPENPTTSSVEVTVQAASIDTANERRDNHLRSADFFDVAKHPEITFKSTKVARAGRGKLKVTGDLTMRGVTKPVTLLVMGPTKPQKSPSGTTVRGVSATGKVNRKDWGLNWNAALEAGGVVVGDEVELQIDAELVSKPAAEAKN